MVRLSSFCFQKHCDWMISFQVRYDGLASRPGGVAILLGMLHATETGNKLQRRGPLARERLYLYLNVQLLGLEPGYLEENHPITTVFD